MKTLEIIYDGPIDHELEKELDKILKKKGWLWEPPGYGFGKRDLSYLRKEDKDVRRQK